LGTNKYNLGSLAVNSTLYTEFAFGYSKEINKKLTVGGKFKFLLGQANVSADMNKLTLNTQRNNWDVDVDGTANAALPYATYGVNQDGKLNNINFNSPSGSSSITSLLKKPLGKGVAIDLGATYKLIDHLTVSGSVLDLGFINWTRGVVNTPVSGSYSFNGVQFDIKDDSTNWVKKYGNQIADTIHYKTTFKSYRTMLPAKVLAGAEYGVLNDKITFGLLSKSTIMNSNLFEEVTTSANFLPVNWFNTSLSYSWMNGRFSNVGVGMQARLGIFSLYAVGDYFPTNYTPQYVPYQTKAFNIQLGLILTFGNPKKIKDDDHDGVPNKRDKCPDTPAGVVVDANGCPVDTDGDGVPDYLDRCPDTPKGVAVDANGCPLDTDGDGVPDYLDKCPGTPVEARATVDENGCPKDSDGDGVPDYLDKCPNTPKGVAVDANGCPIDSDGDGVPDYLDKCPGTPAAARGTVDENGCPRDTDGDGVPDYLDKCPNTPKGVAVDANGCPIDSDGDGVPDYLDKCPGTPAAARGTVDENGCPRDTDGDGVPDYLDNCPTIPGPASNHGCPEIKAAVRKIFEKALRGIQFETGKDVIKPISFPILDQIVKIMNENPDYLINISGHTDNIGTAEKNQILSEKRANAVKNYLVKKGVKEDRITVKGFGDTVPVADNKTPKGRTLNRRVEFVVKFER
jgi:outer membrane protein OmpA-like peptidoglycan-associated protein